VANKPPKIEEKKIPAKPKTWRKKRPKPHHPEYRWPEFGSGLQKSREETALISEMMSENCNCLEQAQKKFVRQGMQCANQMSRNCSVREGCESL